MLEPSPVNRGHLGHCHDELTACYVLQTPKTKKEKNKYRSISLAPCPETWILMLRVAKATLDSSWCGKSHNRETPSSEPNSNKTHKRQVPSLSHCQSHYYVLYNFTDFWRVWLAGHSTVHNKELHQEYKSHTENEITASHNACLSHNQLLPKRQC